MGNFCGKRQSRNALRKAADSEAFSPVGDVFSISGAIGECYAPIPLDKLSQGHPKIPIEMLETGEKIDVQFQNCPMMDKGFRKGIGCNRGICHGAMMNKWDSVCMSKDIDANRANTLREAKDFFWQMYSPESKLALAAKLANDEKYIQRVNEAASAISKTGTYVQSAKEIEFGARLAWRGAARCINRKVYEQLRMLDRRHVETPEAVFQAMLKHIDMVWKGGALDAAISVFAPKAPGKRGMEFISPQLHRFAAYPKADGSVLGDPANIGLTKLCAACGWQAPHAADRTPWDLLPVLIQDEDGHIHSFELPEAYKKAPYILHLTHPDPKHAAAIGSLGLRWVSIPILSTFTLYVGGVAYPCCPFSGWFMQTEIARNLADVQRYNFLPALVEELDLADDIANLSTDRAWLELNTSVLYTFQKNRVAIADHQSTSRAFCDWFQQESQTAPVPGDWIWLVPPVGGSTCPVFHQEMLNFVTAPMYLPNEDRLAESLGEMNSIPDLSVPSAALTKHNVAVGEHLRIHVIVGSQSGNTERIGKQFHKQMKNAGVTCLYDLAADFFEVDGEGLVSPHVQGKLPEPIEIIDDLCPGDAELDRLLSIDRLYLKLGNLFKSGTKLVVMCSTAGNGQFPNSAVAFAQAIADLVYLQGANHEVAQLCQGLRDLQPGYAVCGFGSRSFLRFNNAGTMLDDMLRQLLGSPVCELGACEDQKAWGAWSENLLRQLHSNDHGGTGETGRVPRIQVQWLDREMSHNPSHRSTHRRNLFTRTHSPFSRTQSPKSSNSSATVRGTHSISSAARTRRAQKAIDLTRTSVDIGAIGKVQSVRHVVSQASCNRMVELTMNSPLGVRYQPGDYLSVRPLCPEPVVKELIGLLGLGEYTHRLLVSTPVCSLDMHTSSLGDDEIVEPSTLLDVFRRNIDVCAAPSMGLLQYVADITSDVDLKQLAGSSSAYSAWIQADKPSLLSFVRLYRLSCIEGSARHVPLEVLLEDAEPIRPRQYSISSSPTQVGDASTISITVALHTFQAADGPRQGLASGYLCGLRPHDELVMSVRHGARLSLDGVKRLVLIGTGSGLAPLRAFWGEFSHTQPDGLVVLYQGCQTRSEEAYAGEIQRLVSAGRMEYHLATSREEPKRYVQAALARREELWACVTDPATRVYVSGATRVAQAVRRTLVAAGTRAGLTDAEALLAVQSLGKRKHYVEDVFGGPTEETRAVEEVGSPRVAGEDVWSL